MEGQITSKEKNIEWKGLYSSRICDFLAIEPSTATSNVNSLLFALTETFLDRPLLLDSVTKEVLNRLYTVEHRSYDYIAKYFKVRSQNVLYYLKKYNIPLRKDSKVLGKKIVKDKNGNLVILDKKEIKQLYCKEGKYITEIAKAKNCNEWIIRKFMKAQEINGKRV